MNIMNRTKQILFGQLGLKCAAVASATAVWLFVVSQDLTDRTFLVPLEIVNMPGEMEWSRKWATPDEIVVRVRVRGQRSDQVGDKDLRVVLDLIGSKASKSRVVPLRTEMPRDVVLLGLSPSTVKVILVAKR